VHGLIEQALKISFELRDRWEKHLNMPFYEKVAKDHNDRESSLRLKIEGWKYFRAKWLETYEKKDSASYSGWRLHARFQLYDKKHDVSANFHAIKFAQITELMLAPDDKVGHAERDLYAKWWSLPGDQNPFLVNMGLDKGAVGPFKTDTLTDAFKAGLGQAPTLIWRREAIRMIMEQARIYMVRRVGEMIEAKIPKSWEKEKVFTPIENRIQRLMGLGTEADARRVLSYLTNDHKNLMAGHIKVVRMTENQILGKLEEIMQMDAGTLGYQGRPPQRPRGGKLPNIEKTGSLANGGVDIFVWATDAKTDINQLKKPIPNPLLPAELGLSGIVILLSLINLGIVLSELKPSKNKFEMGLDVLGAVLAVGASTNSALITMKAATPKQYEHIVATSRGKKLASVWATRAFGYGTALVDGITYGIKASNQFDADNPEAGTNYAISGAFLVAGGVMLTSTSVALVTGGTFATVAAGVPVGGWFAAAIILLGTGMVYAASAEKLKFTEMDYWMNASTFGKNASLSNHPRTYPGLDVEVQTFYDALIGPQIVRSKWTNSPSMRLVLTICYPLKGKEHACSSQQKFELHSKGHCKILETIDSPKPLDSGGEIRIYEVLDLREKDDEFSFPITFSYTPDALGSKTSLRYVLRKADKPFLVF
jgi:hypothetical protein